MTFTEYLEDILDMQVGLMSEAEIAQARKGFELFSAPKKASESHPDTKKSITELRARCERLVVGQNNAIARVSDKPEFAAAIIAARAAIAEGRRVLSAKRPAKSEFIAHAEQNSAASREMNAASAN